MSEEPVYESGEDGTTLVELLVVLGLLVLVTIFMTNGLGAVRAMLPVAGRIAAGDEMAAVRDHLRRTVSEAIGQSLLGEDRLFKGETTTLSFVAPSDPAFETGGLVRVLLSLEPDGRGDFSLVERRSMDREDFRLETGRSVLVEGITEFSFSFRRGGETIARIAPGEPLPDLVDIAIAFKAGDSRRWRPLTIALAGRSAQAGSEANPP